MTNSINNYSQECDSDCPDEVFVSTLSTDTEIESILEKYKNRKYNTKAMQFVGKPYLMVGMLLCLSMTRITKKNESISTNLLQGPQIWNNADMFVYAVPEQTNSPVIRLRRRQEQLASNSSTTYTGQASPSPEEHPSIGNTHETEGLPTATGGQPMTSRGQRPETVGPPTATGGQPMTSRGQRPETEGLPTATGGQPMTSRGQRPETVGPPTATGGQPMTSRGQRPEAVGPPTATGVNLPNTGGQPTMSRGHRPETVGPPTATGGQPMTSRGQRPETVGPPTAARVNLSNTGGQSMTFRRQASARNRKLYGLRDQQLALNGQPSAMRREPSIMREQPFNVWEHNAAQHLLTQRVYPHLMHYIREEFDGTPVIRVVLNTDFMNNYRLYGAIYVISDMTRQPATREQHPCVRGEQSRWNGKTSAMSERQSTDRRHQPIREQPSDMRRQRSNDRRQPSSLGEQLPLQPPDQRRHYPCTDLSTTGRPQASSRQHTHGVPGQHFDTGRGETAQTIYPYTMSYRIEETDGTEVIRVIYTAHFMNNVQRYGIIYVSQSPESPKNGTGTSKED